MEIMGLRHAAMAAALALPLGLAAPTAASAQDHGAAPQPPFRPFRYDEDWRAWCAAQPETAPDVPKCIALGEDAMLTLGGDLRERIEISERPRFGLAQPSDRAFLHRALLHADLRAGTALRAFVQLGFFESSGRRGAVPATDVDRLDATQAFVDIAMPAAGGTLTLRPGRQELGFGTSRIVSVRNGPNTRQSFDGVRGSWAREGVRLDAFYLRPVDIERGSFDDPTSDRLALWGAYTTAASTPLGGVDAYYLGYRNERARFAAAAGREERHSLGVRFFGNKRGWDWNFEGLAQFGTIAGQDIRAWTVASDTGYTLPGPLRPRIGFKANIASGDSSPSDGRLGTFNALFPRFPYFSEAALFAPANFYDIHPSLTIQPVVGVTISGAYNRLWRHRTADAVYLAPLAPVAGTAGSPGRLIGDQWIAGADWRLSSRFSIESQYVHFRPGRALEKVGARPGHFGMLTFNYRW